VSERLARTTESDSVKINSERFSGNFAPAISENNDASQKHMKTTTNIIYVVLAVLALACFALSPKAQAVNPPPDGDYPGGNTAEGFNALFSLSPQDGSFNTAVGFYSLFSNVTGSFNTALGAGALDLNTSHTTTRP
jgi:hypothetical protein